jgi:uncharacterized Zn finger protein
MNCLRCQGLMIEDQFLDLEGAFGEMWATSLRCVNCGCVHDAVIEQHRQARHQKVSVPPRGEAEYQDEKVHLGAETFIRLAA